MVRSIIEHCPVLWRPSSNTTINKLDSIQKRSIKWLNQDFSLISYSSNELLYHDHCMQLKILQVRYRFKFHDLKLFYYLIIHEISRIKSPSCLRLFDGSGRLRFTHLDHLWLIMDTVPVGLYNATSKLGFTILQISISIGRIYHGTDFL